MHGPVERHHPRQVSSLGNWEIGTLRLKVYGLGLSGNSVTEDHVTGGKEFIRKDVLPRVDAEGKSNGLGFVIIHPGTTGISTSVHWWIEGCVLCQHIKRIVYETGKELDTVVRPVIGCVWELGIVEAERQLWLTHMMGAGTNGTAYLNARVSMKCV